jgi:glutamate/aspartate transport system substrate-binding protein
VPFSYLNASRRPIGYTIDLCLAIVDAIKEELSLADIDVKYLPVNPNRIPSSSMVLSIWSAARPPRTPSGRSWCRSRRLSLSAGPSSWSSAVEAESTGPEESTRRVTEGTTNEAALKSLNAAWAST